MTEAPKPIFVIIGIVALGLIAGEFYLGYEAMTSPTVAAPPTTTATPASPAPDAPPAAQPTPPVNSGS